MVASDWQPLGRPASPRSPMATPAFHDELAMTERETGQDTSDRCVTAAAEHQQLSTGCQQLQQQQQQLAGSRAMADNLKLAGEGAASDGARQAR